MTDIRLALAGWVSYVKNKQSYFSAILCVSASLRGLYSDYKKSDRISCVQLFVWLAGLIYNKIIFLYRFEVQRPKSGCLQNILDLHMYIESNGLKLWLIAIVFWFSNKSYDQCLSSPSRFQPSAHLKNLSTVELLWQKLFILTLKLLFCLNAPSKASQ